VTACDTSLGEVVGNLSVEYDGDSVIVEATMLNDFSTQKTHFYVGNTALPRDSEAQITVVPDQYTEMNEQLIDQSRDSYTVSASGDIFIIFHAEACLADLQEVPDECSCLCGELLPPTPAPITVAPTVLETPCIKIEKLSPRQTCTYDVDTNALFNFLAGNLTHVSFETFQNVQSRGELVPEINWVATAFKQYGEDSCDKVLFAKSGESNAYDAECTGGYAEIEFYAMYGGFHRRKDKASPPGVCNDYCGCTGRKCGWKFTVPCVSDIIVTEVCTEDTGSSNTNEKDTPAPSSLSPTASPAPTICAEAEALEVIEKKFMSSLGSKTNESMPITVESLVHGEEVTFVVDDKKFSEGEIPTIAVLYTNTKGDYTCEKWTEDSSEFTAQCSSSSDTILVTVYITDTVEGTVLDETDANGKHPACSDLLEGTSQLAVYFYEVPCYDPCDPNEDPDLAPPREPGEPSPSPSLFPSASPSRAYCVEIEPQHGNENDEETCSYSADFIEHVSSNVTHVTFDVLQLFTDPDDTLEWIATYYPEFNSPSCEKISSVSNTGSAVEQITAECTDGWVEIQVFAHGNAEVPDTVIESSAPYLCNAVDYTNGLASGHTCGFTVQIPCVEQLDETCTGTATPSSSPSFVTTFTSTGEMTRSPTPSPVTSSPTTITRTFTEPPKEEACVTPVDATGKLCRTLMTVDSTAVGTVCMEPTDSPLYLDVTVSSTGDNSLVTSAIWFGEDVSSVASDENTGAPNAASFPYTLNITDGADSTSTLETRIYVSGSNICSEDTSSFSLSSLVQATVQQADGTQVEAFAVDEEAGSGAYDGFDMMVNCNCVGESEICIESGVDNIREECHDLIVGENVAAGTVCIEAVDGAEKFKVTYTASSEWTLLTGEFWIGEDIGDVPTDGEGALDTENFPYFYCNSTGEDEWVAKFDMKWDYNCLNMGDTFNLAAVGQATVARIDNVTGDISEDTEMIAFAYEHENSDENFFGWFDIQVNCECIPPESTIGNPGGEPETPDICVKTNTTSTKECHQVFATNDLPAGQVCVEVSEDSEHLEVSFEASGNWTLVTTEFWVGDDITTVPSDADGALDSEGFPYFWCNSTGETSHSNIVDLKWTYLCVDQDEFSLAIVAQLTLSQVDSNGELIEETELISFASEYELSDVAGWFDVAIMCECVPTEAVAGNETETEGECSGETMNSQVIAEESTAATLNSFTPTASRSYAVPTDTDTFKMVFVYHELGSYEVDDTLIVIFNDVEIDLGALADYDHLENPQNEQTGALEGDWEVTWSRKLLTGTDSKEHEVVLSLPGANFSAGTLTAEFELRVADDFGTQAGRVASMRLTAEGSWCEDARRLGGHAAELPCKKELVQVASETYESGGAAGWNNGLIAMDNKFGHFLGRLGRENPAVSKVFAVSAAAESVLVQFSVYTLGSSNWKSTDKFQVNVGIADINLGNFNDAQSEGNLDGIVWSRAVDQADANHHHIELVVTREYYSTGELSLAFEVAMKVAINKKSAGVDNLVIMARGVNSCEGATAQTLSSASGFKVSSLNAAEPDINGDDEDGRGYCRSEDFPCGEDAGMVNVCHYSITSGYQTYCLKEQDSDLVRTYPDDYCGPCTGGYGSTMNKNNLP